MSGARRGKKASPFARALLAPIRFYRGNISPNTQPSCRFRPTCSEYAMTAIARHGALKGSLLSAWRILRCNPFCRGGYDPVPKVGRWRPSFDLLLRTKPGLRTRGRRRVIVVAGRLVRRSYSELFALQQKDRQSKKAGSHPTEEE